MTHRAHAFAVLVAIALATVMLVVPTAAHGISCVGPSEFIPKADAVAKVRISDTDMLGTARRARVAEVIGPKGSRLRAGDEIEVGQVNPGSTGALRLARDDTVIAFIARRRSRRWFLPSDICSPVNEIFARAYFHTVDPHASTTGAWLSFSWSADGVASLDSRGRVRAVDGGTTRERVHELVDCGGGATAAAVRTVDSPGQTDWSYVYATFHDLATARRIASTPRLSFASHTRVTFAGCDSSNRHPRVFAFLGNRQLAELSTSGARVARRDIGVIDGGGYPNTVYRNGVMVVAGDESVRVVHPFADAPDREIRAAVDEQDSGGGLALAGDGVLVAFVDARERGARLRIVDTRSGRTVATRRRPNTARAIGWVGPNLVAAAPIGSQDTQYELLTDHLRRLRSTTSHDTVFARLVTRDMTGIDLPVDVYRKLGIDDEVYVSHGLPAGDAAFRAVDWSDIRRDLREHHGQHSIVSEAASALLYAVPRWITLLALSALFLAIIAIARLVRHRR